MIKLNAVISANEKASFGHMSTYGHFRQKPPPFWFSFDKNKEFKPYFHHLIDSGSGLNQGKLEMDS